MKFGRLGIYGVTVLIVFALFVVANGAFLHRLPGLMGDEGSEGENVFELLESEEIVVEGERSYIGPAIDYLRVPFVGVFGYTALALRSLIFIFSIATFWLAWSILLKQFGRWPGLFGLVMFSFSPVYLLYQRLGWTISLFPFFALLMVWLMQREWKHKWLLVGLAGGVGLANHIIFLPSLVGVGAGLVAYFVLQWFSSDRPTWKAVFNVWPALFGFVAGFGMQFVILVLNKEGDQGDPGETTQLLGERVSGWFESFPLYLSGSSYVARYVGEEFSGGLMLTLSYVLLALALVGIVMLWKRRATWVWVIGLTAHMGALLYVIDRFTLRYFVVIALGVWLLAGLGVGALFERLFAKRERILSGVVIGVAVILMLWMTMSVVIPFLDTGGSVNDFSLGDRTNSANALVDERALIACLRGAGSVHSESVHIWNRLQYLSHEYVDLEVLPEESGSTAMWVVHYREEGSPGGLTPGDLCPELSHFKIVGN